jgi:hypothetical protein
MASCGKSTALRSRVRPENILFEIAEDHLAARGDTSRGVVEFFSALGYRARRIDGSDYTGGPTSGHDRNVWLVDTRRSNMKA